MQTLHSCVQSRFDLVVRAFCMTLRGRLCSGLRGSEATERSDKGTVRSKADADEEKAEEETHVSATGQGQLRMDLKRA